MKLSDVKAKLNAKQRGLQDSFIDVKVLYQCRDLMPERIIVGKDDKNNTIMFEETLGSLRKRHYGKSYKATSYNLLVSDGAKSVQMTEQYLNKAKIVFNANYDKGVLLDFIQKKSKRFNPLNAEKKKLFFMRLTETEIVAVKEFVKKLRQMKEVKNAI